MRLPVSRLPIRKDAGIVDDDTTLRASNELAEGVLHPDEAWIGAGTVKDDVEPVTVAEGTCLDILVFGHLHVAYARAPLHLNGKFSPIGAARSQVEPGVLGETGVTREGRR
jgi:hypothetical protein